MYRSSLSSLVLLLLLFTPPVANVVFHGHFLARRETKAAAHTEDGLERELQTLRSQNANLRQQLRLRQADRELIASWTETHRPHLARVLPVEDPSTQRHSIWIHCRKETPMTAFSRDTAVVSQTGELAGRIRAVYPSARIASVQSLADPHFAVRFRHREARGFLIGTGLRENGRPLLDFKHVVGGELEFEEGAPVFSEGDAVFPEGVLIGEAVLTRGGESGSEFQVLATADLSSLGKVVVLIDDVVGKARFAIKKGRLPADSERGPARSVNAASATVDTESQAVSNSWESDEEP